MAHPYKLTVPRTTGELFDHLGWMALKCPEFEGSYLGQDIDTAFEELELGLRSVFRPGAKLELLLNRAADFRCDAKDTKSGIEIADQMSLIVKQKTAH